MAQTFLWQIGACKVSVQFIYFAYSQNTQINLLLQSTALVTKYNKELQITIIIHFDCERGKIGID